MADYKAIAAVSDSIRYLLESQYRKQDFGDAQLEFRVYVARDFIAPIEAGVTVFLYRVYPHAAQRLSNGRLTSDGHRLRAPLNLDLHFLITAWARDASLQHTIAGWMMRHLEDTPSFPAALLNTRYAGVFHQDETVELALTELSTEELFRIWEVIVDKAYQLSVPYVARVVRIESLQRIEAGGAPVQERAFAVGEALTP